MAQKIDKPQNPALRKTAVSGSVCKCKIHKIPKGIRWLYKCTKCGKSLANE